MVWFLLIRSLTDLVAAGAGGWKMLSDIRRTAITSPMLVEEAYRELISKNNFRAILRDF